MMAGSRLRPDRITLESVAPGLGPIHNADPRRKLTMNYALRCPSCKFSIIEIDHYGERLVGCIECNRWSWPGSNRLIMELPEEDLERPIRCCGRTPVPRGSRGFAMSARIKGRSPDPEAGQPGLPSGVRVTVVSACHPRDSKRPPRKILLARKGLPGCNLESTTPAQKKTAPGSRPEAVSPC